MGGEVKCLNVLKRERIKEGYPVKSRSSEGKLGRFTLVVIPFLTVKLKIKRR